MTTQRRYAIAIFTTVAVAVAGGLWFAHKSKEGEGSSPIPVGAAVNPSAPDSRLLQDVLDIVASRNSGDPNFSYVPKDEPPGLIRMSIGSSNGTVIDNYQAGTEKASALVAFSSKPTDLCANIKDGQVPGSCLRDGRVTPAPQDATFTYVVVYLGSNVGPTLSADGKRGLQKYWTAQEFVPFAQSKWMSDLVTRARNATK